MPSIMVTAHLHSLLVKL